ncbi:MAG: hypothetical protein B7Z10_00460 [Rhodobacterales bacterium 32-66-7]|nr:MAG: hypothetical protein B7Z31_15085 [Rhodobacterales bacterium 12-65-15]OYX27433.1 MAG: hypothetical protein B7Z10_00460 [Rhodobacterales bacterium 32-66-7]
MARLAAGRDRGAQDHPGVPDQQGGAGTCGRRAMNLRRLSQSTLLRFLLVGGSVALAYAVLAALATTYLPLPSPVSAGGLWLAFIPLAYWGQRRFTFADSAPHRHALWLYGATQALGAATVATVSHFLASGAFWFDLRVHLGGSLLAAMLSYAINRLVIFPGRDP